MTHALIPEDRKQRFAMCGSTAWLLESNTDPIRYRVASNRCHDRWCEACAVERRRTVARNLSAKAPSKNLRILTLTLKSNDESLGTAMAKITKSFRRLRSCNWWRSSVVGGIYFHEVTLNQKTNQWHSHLHVLIEGSFLPHEQIKQSWLAITGDSYIVDIRRCRDSRHAASYVAKYAGKAISPDVWHHPAALEEAMQALHSRRLFQPFGSWTKMKLSRSPADDIGWEAVCPLFRVLQLADVGDPWAMTVLCHITGARAPEPRTLFDDVPTPSG